VPDPGPGMIIQLALVLISAAIALSLALAWYEFDRPRHVASWAWSFVVAAVMWGLGLVRMIGADLGSLRTAMLMLGGLAAVLNTLGFQQRADAPERRGALLLLAGGHALVQLLLATLAVGRMVSFVPLACLTAACFWISAATLQGRRRGERAAEYVAEFGMLVFCGFALAFVLALVASRLRVIAFDHEGLIGDAALILPAVLSGVGLFAIVLLTADLADRARRLAVTDMLTGLLNRRGLEEAARTMIERARMHGQAISLGLMDIDRFKSVNDRFGHLAGDRLLLEIARLVEHACPGTLAARIGGEEFAILLPDTGLATAAACMERLRERIASFDAGLPDGGRITASFGLAAYEDDRGDWGDLAALLRRADAALYRSKHDGRNRLTLA
jgi:diguanylate cyclase (GGDEF)-like protein